jgi:asparagine synthase (glutamine-hydrolysing)
MCGITGAVSRVPDLELEFTVRRMNATLVHRGPDGDGFWRCGSGLAALGHRRLAIIDLATGQQPMHDATERYTITLNGEIYNFKTLRAEQEAVGARFRTHSDTEVILNAHLLTGAGAPNLLRGMFAYGLWDRNDHQLTLVRDRFGKKPLFYAEDGDRLLFGSEIKALLTALRRTTVDEIALVEYLMLGYVPGERTIYREIKRVPAGHTLTWTPAAGAQLERYWEWPVPDDRDDHRSEDDWAHEVARIFEDAVRLRLIADVPLGSFLSGGLDSSAVVAACMRGSSRPFHTFSIRAAGLPSPDADAAHTVSRLLGTTHHETVLHCPTVDGMVALFRQFDEPFADSSMIPTAAVSAAARRVVTVALSGDGGDEIFGGYGVYRDYQRVEELARLPFLGRGAALVHARWRRDLPGDRMLEQLAAPDAERYLRLVSHMFGGGLANALRDDASRAVEDAERETRSVFRFPSSARTPGPVARAQWIDATRAYLPGDILPKVDLASMMHGLEVRAPFLDHVLAESVVRLPARLRMHDGRGKVLLRRIAQRYLPDAIIERKKVGFSIPLADWLAGPLRSLVDHYLAPHGPLSRYVDVSKLPRERNDRTANARRTYALLGLAVWAEHQR